MGEAKQRGTFEERRASANADENDCIYAGVTEYGHLLKWRKDGRYNPCHTCHWDLRIKD